MPTTHHSMEQPRDDGAFRSDATDDQLYELLLETVKVVKPTRPEKFTQRLFDERAPTVAKNKQLPLRTAVAVYLRLGQPYDKTWRDLVREAIEAAEDVRDLKHTLAAAKAGPPDWYLDERYVHYALRRAWEKNDRQPIAPDRYDRLAGELVQADTKLKRGDVLAKVMPTANQIITICGTWETACAIAGIPAPSKATSVPGHPPLKVLEHFYETKGRWPFQNELIDYAKNELAIALPTQKTWRISKLKAELVEQRAARGIPTPDDGPDHNKRMSPQELAALLEGAPRRRRPPGYWNVEERVLACLAEYLSMFEGRVDLRQDHYLAHRTDYGWPSLDAITRHGGFQEMLEKARKWRRAHPGS